MKKLPSAKRGRPRGRPIAPPFERDGKNLRTHVLENAQSEAPLTVIQLAEKLGVTRAAIGNHEFALRHEGLIGYRQKPPDPSGRISIARVPTTREHLSQRDILRVLSNIAAHGERGERVTAARTLHELQSRREKTSGPPPPTTPQEKAARLATIMVAVGREVTENALKEAGYA